MRTSLAHISTTARQLLAVRIVSGLADGVFQAALGGAILFNPERHSDPLAIAGGFAVLLLPYSVIGPFAGALLDHWDRRTVLIWANIARALFTAVTAVCVASGSPDTVVLLSALAVTGSSRFVASGLSAGLPQVTDRDRLVSVNAAFTTIGSGALALGAAIAVGLRSLWGADDSGSATTISTAVIAAIAAGAIATGMPARALGPRHSQHPGTAANSSASALRAVVAGFAAGAATVRRTPTIAAALWAIGTHRMAFGLNTLLVLVLAKHAGSGDGLAGVGLVAALTAVGVVIAAITTPIGVARYGRRTTVVTALVIGTGAEATIFTLNGVVIACAAGILGVVGQTAKLCGDAAMQLDTVDHMRGHVFALQDAIFNVAYVIAVTIGAFVIADNGRSPGFAVAGACLYAAGASGAWLMFQRLPRR